MLKRDDLLNYQLKTTVVDLPELGGEVTVSEQTGGERAEIEFKSMSVKDDISAYRRIRALITIHALVDEKGEKLFTFDDVNFVEKLPASVHEKIEQAVIKLGNTKPEAMKTAAKKSIADRKN